MKKVLSFVSCALFVAAMAISCGNKNAEPAEVEATEPAVENVADESSCSDQAAVVDVNADRQAMLDAAAEAGRAKCNCYKTDAATVESCIKSIISQSYAAYEGNEEFKAAMEAEFNSCVKEKAESAVKEAANEGIKAGAEALSKKLGK